MALVPNWRAATTDDGTHSIFCDRVVNDLHGTMISKQLNEPPPPWPKLFWRVYEAFDAGEFHRSPTKATIQLQSSPTRKSPTSCET